VAVSKSGSVGDDSVIVCWLVDVGFPSANVGSGPLDIPVGAVDRFYLVACDVFFWELTFYLHFVL
jgi:hypothetical protein